MSKSKKIDLYDSGNFIVSFPYDFETVQRVKNFRGRKYNPDLKVWIVPILKDNITIIDNDLLDFFLTPPADDAINLYLKSYKKLQKVKEEKEFLSRATTADVTIPGLKGELFPFQKAGVQFIEKSKGIALVADEMGLGKTIQAIAWLQLHPEIRPAFIVCPATLKLNWEREFLKWATNVDPYVVFSNTFDGFEFASANIVIVNYDILKIFCNEYKDEKNRTIFEASDFFLRKKFKAFIGDEIHLVKNQKTKRTQALAALTVNIPNKVILSGTPFLNRPIEIFSALSLLLPDEYNDKTFFKFAKQYCDAKMGTYGWDFSGHSNTDELSHKLRSSIMIRREKKDVLSELPEKVRVMLPIKVDLKEYNKIENNFSEWLIDNDKVSLEVLLSDEDIQEHPLAKIEYLKQAALKAKIKFFIEWCIDFLEGSEEKLVIFGHHKEFTRQLKDELKAYHPVMITGDEDVMERQESVDKFQSFKKHRVAICGLKSANYGITLTAASNVATIEFGWTPAEHEQAEDRTHRIGQKNAVTAYYMVAEGTIEEDIYNLLQSKTKVFKEVMADKGQIKIETKNNWKTEGSILKDLLKIVKTKKKNNLTLNASKNTHK